jgi:probable F420-dependent oxidoreductase
MRPYRFGVITSHAVDGRVWRERARRAEALGYSTLFMPDHFQDQWAPLVGLTVAAEATERLNVGTLVFANDYRHPVVLAKELATLDLASEGRVEVGLGAGWKRSDYDDAGLAYDAPGTRIDRLAEALEVMRALWASPDPVHFAGKHYTIEGVVGTPRPWRERPTVCIGGGGRRMLSLAARVADVVAVNATMSSGVLDASAATTASPVAFDEKLAWVRSAGADRLDAIELQCHCPFVSVGDDGASTLRALASAFGCADDDAIDLPLCLAGTIDEICEAVERRRERWGFSYWVVPDDAMDAFAPVVERLAGTPNDMQQGGPT